MLVVVVGEHADGLALDGSRGRPCGLRARRVRVEPQRIVRLECCHGEVVAVLGHLIHQVPVQARRGIRRHLTDGVVLEVELLGRLCAQVGRSDAQQAVALAGAVGDLLEAGPCGRVLFPNLAQHEGGDGGTEEADHREGCVHEAPAHGVLYDLVLSIRRRGGVLALQADLASCRAAGATAWAASTRHGRICGLALRVVARQRQRERTRGGGHR
mmetsp:Transcript_154630/g.495771  ORF Transcript_154630/g.495771 Transcript_154630/m.495771 type:complete len:213 (-) Transcript_154630:75-713(-)